MAEINAKINNALLRLSRRAEAADRATLVSNFVDTGTLGTLLASRDHQIIFGRRGTGKTHALLYLGEATTQRGDIAVYVDLRTIGSTGGLYADSSIPLAERGTRLLADTLAAVHNSLLNAALAGKDLDLSQLGPALDALAEAATEVVVTGPVEEERTVEASSSEERSATVSVSVDAATPKASLSLGDKRANRSYRKLPSGRLWTTSPQGPLRRCGSRPVARVLGVGQASAVGAA